MPLQKSKSKSGKEEFDTEMDRVNLLCSSLQPLLTVHATEKELDDIFRQADEILKDKRGWFLKLFKGKVGRK